jgi:hypothetical protein
MPKGQHLLNEIPHSEERNWVVDLVQHAYAGHRRAYSRTEVPARGGSLKLHFLITNSYRKPLLYILKMADFTEYAGPSADWVALEPSLPKLPNLPVEELKQLLNKSREDIAAQGMSNG